MPRAKATKNTTGNTTPAKANEQKGSKQCTCCKEPKKMTDFYISLSPMYALDQRVPVCKECCKSSCLNDDGSVNLDDLKILLRQIDKPLYYDQFESAIQSVKKENSYISSEEVNLHGKDILQKYFTLIATRQDKARSFSDSEQEGFIHQNTNRKQEEINFIKSKYSKYLVVDKLKKTDTVEIISDNTDVKWSKKDKQNMKYVISTVGYDPFEDVGLSEADRKYCFNILSGYCDTDGISEDGHKMQGVIEMTMLYCQCKKITEAMNIELSKETVDDAKVSKLTSSKSSLLSSIATIAKDNNIASNYNKNSKQGQNSLTSKMKEMEENDFEAIKVNLFDIKTSEAFKQIADLSNQSIMDQLTFDNNDYTEIVKEQREMIQKYEHDCDELKEENRNLKNKIIDLENRKR